MTQINRETAIALAKEAGMAGMLTDVVCSLEEIHRLCNLAVAHSRKDAEAVAYQYRMKPEWHDAWVKWQPCDKANFDDYVKAPVVNGWQFDARALYAHPPEADKPNPLEDLNYAKMMVRSSGYSLVSADFINSFAEFIQDWRKGDFDLPKLAALDVKACFDAWQKEVNQNEVKPVLQALERVPMTEWQPIDTAPKDGRTLLLGYFNSHKKWRTMRGQWFSQDVINEEWEEPDMAGEGWYETCVENDDMPNCWWTAPTHWHPLPTPPESKG